MATTLSIFKHVINLNRENVDRIEIRSETVSRLGEPYTQEQAVVHIRPFKRDELRCPVCRKKCPGYDTSPSEVYWRAPNLNGMPVYLAYRPRRISCPEHGVLREYLCWQDGDSRSTGDFNNEIAYLALQMPRTAVAEFASVNWRTVGNCIRAAHERIEPDPRERLRGLKRICVDETSYSRGFLYITVVYDMDRNRTVWVSKGNGYEVFREFCLLLTPEERNQIEVIAGDGAKWMDTCAREFFPNAKRCVDFFHVASWVNGALDQVRRDMHNQAARDLKKAEQEFRKSKPNHSPAVKKAEAELQKLPKRGRPSKRKKRNRWCLNDLCCAFFAFSRKTRDFLLFMVYN